MAEAGTRARMAQAGQQPRPVSMPRSAAQETAWAVAERVGPHPTPSAPPSAAPARQVPRPPVAPPPPVCPSAPQQESGSARPTPQSARHRTCAHSQCTPGETRPRRQTGGSGMRRQRPQPDTKADQRTRPGHDRRRPRPCGVRPGRRAFGVGVGVLRGATGMRGRRAGRPDCPEGRQDQRPPAPHPPHAPSPCLSPRLIPGLVWPGRLFRAGVGGRAVPRCR